MASKFSARMSLIGTNLSTTSETTTVSTQTADFTTQQTQTASTETDFTTITVTAAAATLKRRAVTKTCSVGRIGRVLACGPEERIYDTKLHVV